MAANIENKIFYIFHGFAMGKYCNTITYLAIGSNYEQGKNMKLKSTDSPQPLLSVSMLI